MKDIDCLKPFKEGDKVYCPQLGNGLVYGIFKHHKKHAYPVHAIFLKYQGYVDFDEEINRWVKFPYYTEVFRVFTLTGISDLLDASNDNQNLFHGWVQLAAHDKNLPIRITFG